MEGLIYIMRADVRIKIGWSAGNVEKRKAELQTGCPHPLEVLATFAGSREEEGRCRRRSRRPDRCQTWKRRWQVWYGG